MPFALIVIGIVFIIAGVRGKASLLYSTLKNEFTGSNNYVIWGAAIIAVGAIGYIPQLQKFSRAMLALVIIVLLLSHSGFFAMLKSYLPNSSALQVPTLGSNGGGI